MADQTTKFESSQALFCAFVDQVGKAKSNKLFFGGKGLSGGNLEYGTYNEFINDGNNKKNIAIAFKNTDTPGMNLNDMEKFLKSDVTWFHSSVIIAVKLITELHKKTKGGSSLKKFHKIGAAGMQHLDYVRGDSEVMGMLGKLFKIAKTNAKNKKKLKGMEVVEFGDINKWNPGDIYYASDKARKALKVAEEKSKKNSMFSFAELNQLTTKLMIDGELLAVSLKKQTKPAAVQISLVNFDVTYKKQLLRDVKYQSHSGKKITIAKRDGKKGEVPKNTKTPTRDFKVQVQNGLGTNVGYIQMRHDPSKNGSWKVDFKYTGAEARGGSVVSHEIFSDLWGLVDKQIGTKFKRAYELGKREFISQVYGKPAASKDKELNNNFKYFGSGGLLNHIPGKKSKPESNQKRLWKIPFKGEAYDDKKGRYKSSAYDFQKGEISAITVMNRLIPILNNWFSKATEKEKNDFVRAIYQYVTSRHPHAGKFVIAK